jgi:hypothetical protein
MRSPPSGTGYPHRVDQVARAIRVAHCGEGAAEAWDRLPDQYREPWRREARAALAVAARVAVDATACDACAQAVALELTGSANLA